MRHNTTDSIASKLLSIPVVAARLSVKKSTAYDRRWRKRVGLKLVRIGRRVGILEEDVDALLRAGRER